MGRKLSFSRYSSPSCSCYSCPSSLSFPFVCGAWLQKAETGAVFWNNAGTLKGERRSKLVAMRHKWSVDKGRRMEKRKDSVSNEQDVQNERYDRTREAKTVESSRERSWKQKEIYEKIEKKKLAGVEYRSTRERLNRRQSYRRGREPTEETQRCRNNRGIERETRIKLRGKSRRCGGRWGEKTEREKGLTGR